MSLRSNNLQRLKSETFDTLVIGGGINGAVAASSLAAQGARVALIDRGDFAGFTSSNSSNLAWGGIKYLESHEYLLVNKLCKSRNHLMRAFDLFFGGRKDLIDGVNLTRVDAPFSIKPQGPTAVRGGA